MAIEVLSPSQVRINGYFVELFDNREPDMLDIQTELANKSLRQEPRMPLQDQIFSLDSVPGLVGFDPVFAAYQQIPRFVDLARRSADEAAVSYRNFKVGASACAIDDKTSRIGYFFGANYKPSPNSDKYCAELDIVRKVRSVGFNKIIALTIFGPSEFADVDIFPSPTLHPCVVCRKMLGGDSLFADNPLVITTNREGDMETFLTDQLISLHMK
ncbi:MAG: cytidine deaminase [Candidatus Saccharimonadales bacterium]